MTREEVAAYLRACEGADAGHSRMVDVCRYALSVSDAAALLLAALDKHEDAADPVFGEGYHPDHEDAVYAAKAALRDLLSKESR